MLITIGPQQSSLPFVKTMSKDRSLTEQHLPSVLKKLVACSGFTATLLRGYNLPGEPPELLRLKLSIGGLELPAHVALTHLALTNRPRIPEKEKIATIIVRLNTS